MEAFHRTSVCASALAAEPARTSINETYIKRIVPSEREGAEEGYIGSSPAKRKAMARFFAAFFFARACKTLVIGQSHRRPYGP
jgi:hypothetical protein